MRNRAHIALLLACLAGPAAADEIFKVKSPENWEPNQEVCFSRKRELIACGKVISSSTYRILVKNPKLAAAVRRGDRVYVQATGIGRQVASVGTTYVVTKVPHDRLSLSAGGYASERLIYPLLHVQAAVTPTLAIGLLPSYGKIGDTNSTISVLGSFLTFEAYFRNKVFEGPSLLLGAGVYSLKIESLGASEGIWTPAGIGTIGWRFLSRTGIHIGLALGGQYVSPIESQLVILPIQRFSFIGKIDVGFAF